MTDSQPRPVGQGSYRPPTAPPRMRPRRRATSPGTGPVEPDAVPAEPAPDDSDVGWGDRPPADEETRYLADRPPHWGSD
ncbi:hypothetical protein [Klenkia terrae]|uniref:Uncharacterized protein n=1 Tax=Klenkia terrae TaxID=1052259 RepID=A0ABU8E0T2_9ACTN|nr:hypothetical protein [Klenkia terrae]SSC24537.1 Hypothetical protein KLENKIAIHU_3152 [Klenkia terrae]